MLEKCGESSRAGSDPALEKKCGELAEGQSRPKGSLEGMRSTIPLANREAEGREDGGQGGESDVDNYAPLVFILVGHCCDFSLFSA